MPRAKAVAEVDENKALAVTSFEEDQGIGSENIGKDDLAIPFITILQKGSPQVDEASGAYIEGAKAGMIFNTVTNRLYPADTGIHVLPCSYNREYVEWKDRDSGGGFVAQHPISSNIKDQATPNSKNIPCLPNGNLLVETSYRYVVVMHDDGTAELAVISMSSTQLKKSRKWNSLIKGIQMPGKNGPFNPPSFSHVYHLTTVPESKDQYTWYGWNIEIMGPVSGEQMHLYGIAKEFANQVNAGLVKVAPPADDTSEGSLPDQEVF